MANAQKGGPVRKQCVEQYPDPNGKCVIDQCKAQCAKNRKGGLARCIDTGKGHMQCRCDYHCWFLSTLKLKTIFIILQ